MPPPSSRNSISDDAVLQLPHRSSAWSPQAAEAASEKSATTLGTGIDLRVLPYLRDSNRARSDPGDACLGIFDYPAFIAGRFGPRTSVALWCVAPLSRLANILDMASLPDLPRRIGSGVSSLSEFANLFLD